MTQEEIKAQYGEYMNEIAFHRGEIEVLRARIGVLNKQCKHPDLYTYYAMGEPGIKCPDCGYQT